jgi:DNA-binding response OmpR family regulator
MYPARGCLWAGLAMSQKKILVVDDDPDVRLALQVRLNANHYDVVCAGDGVTSVSEAQKEKPDLIILDLGLPAGDGFSVLQRMKANERLASIPVIVLTGRDHVENRDRAIKAGAKTFLQKPMEHGKLMAVILRVLEAKEHPAALIYDLGDAGPKNSSPSAERVTVRDEGLDV